MGSEKKIGFLVRPPPFYGGNPYEELIQMTDGSQKPFCSFARAKKKRSDNYRELQVSGSRAIVLF